MRLLVITQKMDRNDPVLGFFHNWIDKLSVNFEEMNVICLGKGEIDLLANVRVFSLGKVASSATRRGGEEFFKKLRYIFNFYKYIWQLRSEYDAVFVHMNQEYILLGGIFWKLLGKKIYFWRNHPKGSLLTQITVWLSEKVFYTSPKSYTARFKKGVLMPVGIDTDKFNSESRIQNLESRKGKILSLGRISPIKNIDKLIDAAVLLDQREVDFVLDIVGDPANPEDLKYYDRLKEKAGDLIKKVKVNFLPAVDQEGAVKMYQSHDIFVNLTPIGSMDKTILEAIGCGCIPVVANEYYKDVKGVLVTNLNIHQIAESLKNVLGIEGDKIESYKNSLRRYVVENHSLSALMERLKKELKNV